MSARPGGEPPHAPSVAISGASGFIGSALARAVRASGGRVLRLVRRPARGDDEVSWDPAGATIEAARLEGVHAVVHLAGAEIAVRWNQRRKGVIRQSRIGGTRLLATALAKLERPPHVLVSGSAIGYYGDRGDEWLTEESAAGADFLATTAVEWEAATRPAADAGIRVVLNRTGLVIGQGGLLQRMLPPFRFGLGGKLGDGRQWMSWISIEDLVAALRFAIDAPDLSGPVNAVAPEPVTNEEFTRTLARVLRRPAILPVPPIALRAVFGEMADAMILASQRVAPERLLDSAFEFRHRRLEDALRATLEP